MLNVCRTFDHCMLPQKHLRSKPSKTKGLKLQLLHPSKHFGVLQTFVRKRLAKVKKMMGTKTICNRIFLKHFKYTVY